MNLYKKCLDLSDSLMLENKRLITKQNWNIAGPEDYLKDNEMLCALGLQSIYYISDIHLGHHISKYLPENSTNLDIKNYIKNIIISMFTEEIKKSIRKNSREIIFLFGGDISSIFEISKIFYTEFMVQLKKLLTLKTIIVHILYMLF